MRLLHSGGAARADCTRSRSSRCYWRARMRRTMFCQRCSSDNSQGHGKTSDTRFLPSGMAKPPREGRGSAIS